jgi:hypothetical protein
MIQADHCIAIPIRRAGGDRVVPCSTYVSRRATMRSSMTRLRAATLSLTLVLASAGCGGGTSRGPGNATAGDWLDGTNELTEARFDRVMSVVVRDPDGNRIALEAVARLGRGSPAVLRSRFRVCVGAEADGLEGKTYTREELHLVGRGEGFEAALEGAIRSGDPLDVRVEEGPDFVMVSRWLMPRICIQPGLGTTQAAEAFVHELIHALRRDPRINPDPVAFDDESYARAVVQLPGDEVDAYAGAVRVRIRLDGQQAIAPQLARVFDPAGNLLVSRDDLGRIVLARQPQGLGYADGLLAGARQKAIASEAKRVAMRRDLLAQYADFRRQEAAVHAKNIEIFTGNLKVYEHNIGVAQQRNDPALEQKTRAQLAAEQRTLADARTKLAAAQASEERVRADLGPLDMRLAQLGGH